MEELGSKKETVNYKSSVRMKTNVNFQYSKTRHFVGDLLHLHVVACCPTSFSGAFPGLREKALGTKLRVVTSCQICNVLDLFWMLCFGLQ